jgi:hypothetical protein
MFIHMTFTKINEVPGQYCWTLYCYNLQHSIETFLYCKQVSAFNHIVCKTWKSYSDEHTSAANMLRTLFHCRRRKLKETNFQDVTPSVSVLANF